MKDNILTVFTPAYNRADLLKRCYNALKNQTDKDFVWIIVDDGSKDNTRETVAQWIKEDKDIDIRYFYKENGGLHTAYNVAVENMDTELCVCIDSDDYPSNNCVELIKKCWNDRDKSKDYAGIFGLNYTPEGELIGGEIDDYDEINIVDWTIGNYPVKKGDKKVVVRVDLYKQGFPMRVFEGEKNFNPNYVNILSGVNRPYISLNECLCYVDYQQTGMTNNMLWQYYNSPNSFAEIRLLYLSFSNAPIQFLLKNCVHYDSSCILARRKGFIKECPHPVMATFCLPLGFLLSRYVKLKNRGR